MADKTLTVTTVGEAPKTLTFNRDQFAGVRTMTRVEAGGATTAITVNRAASSANNGDKVGQSRPLLSKVVGGAAAAYSLRDLNDKANANKVVRVRRESDHHERDFNAKEVSNGTLQNWTNAQVTPPLDVRELTATGRDGAVIEAAAAYSLRNLSDSYTGSVVEVRRSSDDAVRSFTAAEVTDGTLVTWVNEEVTVYTQAVDLNVPTGSGSFVTLPSYNIPNTAGNRYRVTFELKHNGSGAGSASSPSLRGTGGWSVSNVTKSSNLTQLSNRFPVNNSTPEYQTYTVTFTTDAGSSTSPLRFQTYDTARTYTVRNFTTEILGQDGTVSKWYDQSTTSGVPNANHAVQTSTASQPKIVSGGVYLGYLTKNAAESGFNSGISLPLTGSFSVFYRTNFSTTSCVLGGDGTIPRLRHLANQVEVVNNGDTEVNFSQTSVGNADAVYSLIRDSSNDMNLHKNGALITGSPLNLSGSFLFSHLAMRTSDKDGIEGRFYEIIVYNTDQTDNRTALEANIGEVYGIAGIPAYDNTVNGFVETWYDQSGNGNNATQLTASNQPRIVIDGELIMNAKGFPSIAQYRGGAGTNVNRSFVINNGLPVLNSTHFAVTQYNRQFSYHLIGTAAAGSSRVGRYSSDQFRISQGGTSATSGAVFPTSVVKLATVNNAASGGTTTGFVDGVQAFSANLADPSSTGLVYKYLFRGDNDSSGALLYSEFIYYSSDQSANRPAIEANINNQYEIY
jgi:hypothetical protein